MLQLLLNSGNSSLDLVECVLHETESGAYTHQKPVAESKLQDGSEPHTVVFCHVGQYTIRSDCILTVYWSDCTLTDLAIHWLLWLYIDRSDCTLTNLTVHWPVWLYTGCTLTAHWLADLTLHRLLWLYTDWSGCTLIVHWLTDLAVHWLTDLPVPWLYTDWSDCTLADLIGSAFPYTQPNLDPLCNFCCRSCHTRHKDARTGQWLHMCLPGKHVWCF